jgi:signal transduction histidine kinase
MHCGSTDYYRSYIEADKNRINQMISNLLSNAIKFTDEGTVSITVVPNTNEIVVSITDTGPGIDSEILPRLFTKFAKKEATNLIECDYIK